MSPRAGVGDRPTSRRARAVRWFLFALAALAWTWPLSTPLLDRLDSVGYLAPAVSLVDDGDLMYYDEYDALGMNELFFRPTRVDLIGNHWNSGFGLAMVPSLAMARVLEPGDAVLGGTGLAVVQVTALVWAALLAFLLVAFVRKRVLGDDRGSLAWSWGVAAAVYLGTPLVFYAHVQTARPHLLAALLSTALVAHTLAKWERPSAYACALAGILVGALVLVRTQAALIVLLPMASIAWRLWDQRHSTDRSAAAARALGRAAALLAPALAAWYLQRSIGVLIHGAGNTGSLVDALLHVDINIGDALVNPHHGLLPWSPVVLFALCGLALYCRRHPRLAPPILLFLLLQLYLNGTSYYLTVDAHYNTRTWAAGASFGARRFVCCLPLFALGLAELVRRARNTRWLVPLGLSLLACALWSANLALFARAQPYEVLEQRMSWSRLLEVQWQALTSISDSIAVALAARPATADGARALLAVAVPTLLAVGLVLLWRRTSPGRRPLYLVAICIMSVIFAVVAARQVAANTRAARDASQGALTALRQRAEANNWRIQRWILLRRARIREISGDPRDAMSQYEKALRLGLGKHSLMRYLELALELEGWDGVDARLRELERAYPGHPILAEVEARFARKHPRGTPAP